MTSSTDIQLFRDTSELLDTLSLPTGTRGQPVYANNKPFYVVLENCKYTASSSYSNKSYLSFECPPETCQMIQDIENKVVKLAQDDKRFSVMDNVKMTPKTWQLYWRSSIIDDKLFKVTLKDDTEIFNKNKELATLAVLTSNSQVNLLVTPTNFWCMSGKVGISWTVRQIRKLSDEELGKVSEAINWEIEEDDEY